MFCGELVLFGEGLWCRWEEVSGVVLRGRSLEGECRKSRSSFSWLGGLGRADTWFWSVLPMLTRCMSFLLF